MVEVVEIDIAEITPNPRQPRTSFDREKLEELANSIKQHGLLEPIIVRNYRKGYQIVCGERRWKAFQLLNRPKIPAIVKDIAEEDVLLKSLIENIHRDDLTSVERENAVHELWASRRYRTQQELANALGYSQYTVSHILDAYEMRHKFEERYISAEIVAATISNDKYRTPEMLPGNISDISTRTIQKTMGLKEDERLKVMDMVAKGKLEPSSVEEFVADVKSVPEPVRKALIEGKIEHDDVKPYIDTIKDKPEQADMFVEEFTIRKQEKEKYKEAEIERDRAIIQGELKPTITKYDPSVDEKLFKKFDDVWITFHYLQPFDITSIRSRELQRKAIDRVKLIQQHATMLLQKLSESGVV